jgi:hypothetical protein
MMSSAHAPFMGFGIVKKNERRIKPAGILSSGFLPVYF